MTPERWQQIEALYHAARTRPAHERATYLAEACAFDEGLRREVERLLSQPGSHEGFLAGPVANMATGLADVPPVMVGRTLGGYQVQALIGVGGMGEVYRARDAKLGRAVAIKVLPHAFTSDPARLARFEREARTLAALNHPNICAIHGFEEADQVRFLILELVEGQTLADRLSALRMRPGDAGLAERDALAIARQIARALDFAHERGIIHRDLKPANIKIGPDGSVKVLDFGLAKAVAGDSADIEPAPTVTADRTIDGAIVGTPAYMSPEQARGKAVDKRTDIWSFGCVLYEMLAGRAVFAGDTLADTIAKVIEREPDWTALPADTPEPIRNLLLGCLAKDPRERLRDMGDVRITIDSILSGSSSGTTVATSRRSTRPSAAWLPWAVVAVLVVVIVWSLRPRPTAPAPVARVNNDLPAGQSLDGSGGAHLLTLSRDGKQLAYVAHPGLLYIRPISDDPEAKPVPGTEKSKGVREPRFSPNGKEIAFYSFDDRQLKRMSVAGGETSIICDAETPTGIDWGPNGIVLFGQGRNGIWLGSVNSRATSQISSVGPGEQAHGPHLLPDGDHFLYTIAKGHRKDRWDNAEIWVGSLSSPTRSKLNLTGSDAQYVRSTGHLLYAVSGIVYAVPFDPKSRKLTGTGVRVEEGVSRATAAVTGAANFSVSDNGTFAFVKGPPDGVPFRLEMALFDPSGKVRPNRLNAPPDQYEAMRVSPDESMVAFGNEADEKWRIYTLPINRKGSHVPVTPADSDNRFPVWTRDSARIAFQSNRGGGSGIWWQEADGSDQAVPLTKATGDEIHMPESWSKDDTTLLYSVTKNGLASLWTLPVRNGKPGEPQPFGRSTSAHPMSGVFSPDGRLVAYTKTENHETTICVERFPSTVVSRSCLPPNLADSPKHPQWSRDGNGVFFDPRRGDFAWVSVSAEGTVGTPEPVAYPPFRLSPPGTRTPYDITSSGQLLGLIPPGLDEFRTQPASTIVVVLNWFEALKEKMK